MRTFPIGLKVAQVVDELVLIAPQYRLDIRRLLRIRHKDLCSRFVCAHGTAWDSKGTLKT